MLTDSDKKDIRSIRRLRFMNMILLAGFICAMVGLVQDGKSIIDSVFNFMMMLALNYDADPPNIWVNIARFLAAIFTFSAIVSFLETATLIIADRIKGVRKDSLFVFGDPQVSQQVGHTRRNVIDGSNGFVEASNYLLMGSEDENLSFYAEHRDRLLDKKVYLKTEILPGMLLGEDNLKSFCLEELAATQFWKKFGFIDRAYNVDGKASQLSVVIIGFNKLAEELLFEGIQTNCYADVTWHVFGDTHRYRQLHRNLDMLKVHCYDDAWYDEIDLLRDADLIILADQNDQLRSISDFFVVCSDWRLVVCTAFTAQEESRRILLQHRSGSIPDENLVFFDWRREGGSLEQVRSEEAAMQQESGRLAHIVYDNWDELDTFKRYSYVHLLEFRDLCRSLEAEWGKDIVTDEEKARFLHNRLCAYYFYNNWSYSPNPDPADPDAQENSVLRLHSALLPFEELSEDRKRREFYIIHELM